MKRRHKIAAGWSVAGLAALLTAGVEVWDRYDRWRAAHVAADNHAAYICEVRSCEQRGGKWLRGDCLFRRRRER